LRIAVASGYRDERRFPPIGREFDKSQVIVIPISLSEIAVDAILEQCIIDLN
jgi:hypothetical protein